MKRYVGLALCGVAWVLMGTSCPVNKTAQIKVLFQTTRNDSRELFVMDLDGTGLTTLTPTAGRLWDPHWSPAGQKILFQASSDGYPQIYSMNPDGTGVQNLTNSASADTFLQFVEVPNTVIIGVKS
jgi:Tol biopolymer transport system component